MEITADNDVRLIKTPEMLEFIDVIFVFGVEFYLFPDNVVLTHCSMKKRKRTKKKTSMITALEQRCEEWQERFETADALFRHLGTVGASVTNQFVVLDENLPRYFLKKIEN